MKDERNHMSFFEDFYYGNLEPQALPLSENLELKQHFDDLCQIEIEFKKVLNKESQELFDKYVETYNKFDDVLSFLIFKKGFSYGMKLAFAAFNNQN